MSFQTLYDEVQTLSPKIRTNFLRQRALELSRYETLRELWSGELDDEGLRGCFLSGPIGPPLDIGPKGAAIILARSLNTCWRRFVLTKELMHVFDTDEELTDTPEKLDAELFGLEDPRAVGLSPQLMAEHKAFWRALAVLCPEKDRLYFKKKMADSEMSAYDVALRLKIPQAYIGQLMHADFLDIVKAILK